MSTAVSARKKTGPKPKYKSLVEHIEKMSIPVTESGCWIWIGSTANGYGQLTHNGKHITAHRASFIAFNPKEETPFLVCHKCDVRECVNPAHLYSGDYKTNRKDMLSRKRWSHPYSKRTHCFAGHEYEIVGFSISKSDGSRVCKVCQREDKRKQRQLKGNLS